MRNSLILILSIFIFQSCATQDSDSQKNFNVNHGVFTKKIDESLLDSIQLFKLDKTEGVIFPAKYAETLWNGFSKYYTPSRNEIIKVNEGLKSQYCKAIKNFNDFFKFEEMSYSEADSEEVKIYKDFLKDEERWFKKNCPKKQKDLKRKHKQFIGYYNDYGEKMIAVQILDFREDPYNLKNSFYTSWIGGWHGWFETNREVMHYNLNTGILTVNSDL